MEIESKILALRSKQQVEKVVRWVGTDPKRCEQLMNWFLDGSEEISKRSAWVLGHCCERHPELAKPWIKPMVKKLQESDTHSAVQRNIMRILQFVEIPKALKGTVVNICFNFISDTKSEIAPQALAMTVLSNIAKKEPDLLNELHVHVTQMLPYTTPAFRARAKKIFKNLEISEKQTVLNKKDEDRLLHDWLMKKE
jgi:hypothetical protein